MRFLARRDRDSSLRRSPCQIRVLEVRGGVEVVGAWRASCPLRPYRRSKESRMKLLTAAAQWELLRHLSRQEVSRGPWKVSKQWRAVANDLNAFENARCREKAAAASARERPLLRGRAERAPFLNPRRPMLQGGRGFPAGSDRRRLRWTRNPSETHPRRRRQAGPRAPIRQAKRQRYEKPSDAEEPRA